MFGDRFGCEEGAVELNWSELRINLMIESSSVRVNQTLQAYLTVVWDRDAADAMLSTLFSMKVRIADVPIVSRSL